MSALACNTTDDRRLNSGGRRRPLDCPMMFEPLLGEPHSHGEATASGGVT